MTVAIKKSLTELNDTISALAKTAQSAQENAKNAVAEASAKAKTQGKSSPDLFSVPKTPSSDVDAKALANRLDSAIERVEEMLKEGA